MAVVEGRQLEDPPRDASSRKPADGALAPRAPPPADTSLPSDVLVCLHGGMKSRKQLLVAFGHFFSHIESCYSGYGWDAVEIYEKEHSRMGALILPTIFSDMTGLECAQEVRKLEALQGLRRIPIALYATNPSFAVTEPELVAAGADYLLICPFTLADASRCVRACLSLRASYDGPGPYDSNNNNHNGVAIFPSKTGLGPLAGGGQHNNAKFRIGGNYANSGNPHDPYGGLIPDVEPNNGAEYSRGYGSSRMVSHGDGGWGGRQPQPHGPSKGNKGSIQHGHGNHYASHHGNGGHNSGGGGGGGAPVAPAALIVGNVTWSRMLAPELLRPYFETVHFASSAAEALELVTAHVYLVVFMDVNLPDNEGIRCARSIRRLEAQRNHRWLPVVAMCPGELSRLRRAPSHDDDTGSPGSLWGASLTLNPGGGSSITALGDPPSHSSLYGGGLESYPGGAGSLAYGGGVGSLYGGASGGQGFGSPTSRAMLSRQGGKSVKDFMDAVLPDWTAEHVTAVMGSFPHLAKLRKGGSSFGGGFGNGFGSGGGGSGGAVAIPGWVPGDLNVGHPGATPIPGTVSRWRQDEAAGAVPSSWPPGIVEGGWAVGNPRAGVDGTAPAGSWLGSGRGEHGYAGVRGGAQKKGGQGQGWLVSFWRGLWPSDGTTPILHGKKGVSPSGPGVGPNCMGDERGGGAEGDGYDRARGQGGMSGGAELGLRLGGGGCGGAPEDDGVNLVAHPAFSSVGTSPYGSNQSVRGEEILLSSGTSRIFSRSSTLSGGVGGTSVTNSSMCISGGGLSNSSIGLSNLSGFSVVASVRAATPSVASSGGASAAAGNSTRALTGSGGSASVAAASAGSSLQNAMFFGQGSDRQHHDHHLNGHDAGCNRDSHHDAAWVGALPANSGGASTPLVVSTSHVPSAGDKDHNDGSSPPAGASSLSVGRWDPNASVGSTGGASSSERTFDEADLFDQLGGSIDDLVGMSGGQGGVGVGGGGGGVASRAAAPPERGGRGDSTGTEWDGEEGELISGQLIAATAPPPLPSGLPQVQQAAGGGVQHRGRIEDTGLRDAGASGTPVHGAISDYGKAGSSSSSSTSSSVKDAVSKDGQEGPAVVVDADPATWPPRHASMRHVTTGTPLSSRLMSALFRRHSADNVQGRHMRATTDTAAAHALPLPRAFMVPDGGNSTDPNALPGDLPPWAPPAAGMSFRVRFFGCRKATDASSPTEPRPLPPTEASPESSTQGLTSASGSNRKKHEPSAVGIPTPAGFKDLAPASACGVRLPWRRHTGESKLEPGCAFRRIGSATNMASDCLARMRRGQRRHTHS